MQLNFERAARLTVASGLLSISANAWADTANVPAALSPSSDSLEVSPKAPDSAPTSAEAAVTPELTEDASWSAAYARARSAMAQGQFKIAQSSFADLEQSARTPAQRALCTELHDLAEQWLAAGLTLSRPSEGAGEPARAASNERSTDEISVLYLNAVVYGLGTGIWLAALTEPKDAASGILPTLALAGAAAGAVALVDHEAHLAYGVPASAVTGLYIGLEEGITWSIWNQAKSPYYAEWQGKTVATVIWGSASVGAITGATVGALLGTTPGRASYVGSTALWGGLLTGLFSAAASSDDRGQRDDHGLLGAALGTNIGAVAGILSAGLLSPSVARVRFIDLGGIAGGLLAGGLYVSAADKLSESNAQGLFGVTALGTAGGLVLSAVLTQGMPADRGALAETPSSALNIEPTLIPVRGGTLFGAAGTF